MLGQDHYLHRLRAACVLQPELNRHQLAALDRELTLVASCLTPEEHLEKSGNLLGILRAAEQDRAANLLDVALRHDDPWAAAAARLQYHHASQGANHAELYAHLQRGHERAARLLAISAGIHASFLRLLLNLLYVHSSNYETGPAYAAAAAAFQFLRANDPLWTPATWRAQPRYARRLPWHSSRIDEWMAPYFGQPAPPAPALPEGHRIAIDPGDWGAVEWPGASPLVSPADTAIADGYLARQTEWPDAFLEQHWRTTREALLAAGTPIAQHAVLAARQALFSEESARHLLELTAVLAPLRAAANHGWAATAASREGLAKAVDTAHALTGLDSAAILALPFIQHFLRDNLKPFLARGADGFGALDGEAGFDLAKHAAACLQIAGHIDFAVLFSC